VVRNAVAGLGFDQDAAMVVFPIDPFLVGSDLSPIEMAIDKFADGLTGWHAAATETGLRQPTKLRIEANGYEAALDKMNRLFLTSNWGDGLPLNAPTDNYMIYKWNEVIRHVNYAPYYIAFYPWMVNAAWWDGLDPELQEIIRTTAIEVAENNRALAEAASDKALEDMRADGVDVHVQTPEEIAAWTEAAQPVWDEFQPEIGDDLIEAIKSYAK